VCRRSWKWWFWHYNGFNSFDSKGCGVKKLVCFYLLLRNIKQSFKNYDKWKILQLHAPIVQKKNSFDGTPKFFEEW